MTHRALITILSLLLLAACGAEESAPEPEQETAAEPAEPEPAPEPEPEPEPEPVEIADCPDDTWSVAANGPNRAPENGVEAAGWARNMGSGWTSLRVCKTIDEFEVRLSCAPVQGGAECDLSLPDEYCTATLPQPLVPAAVGQLVDTEAKPTEGTWSCNAR